MKTYTLETLPTVEGRKVSSFTDEEIKEAIWSLNHIAEEELDLLLEKRIRAIYGQGTGQELKRIDECLQGVNLCISVALVATYKEFKVPMTYEAKQHLIKNIRLLTRVMTTRSIKALREIGSKNIIA